MERYKRANGRLRAAVSDENGNFWKYANITVLIIVNAMFFVLATHENFWYDEAYTVGMIFRDFQDILEITSNDVHTPFYYFVLKLFYQTIGCGQLISIKIFSWIFLIIYFVFGGGFAGNTIAEKLNFFG